MLEALMLVCFGVSWPVSIYKTCTVKQVTGKSRLFLWLVFSGYLFGLLNKVLYDMDWVTAIYAFNGTMVLADLVLHYRYSCGCGGKTTGIESAEGALSPESSFTKPA